MLSRDTRLAGQAALVTPRGGAREAGELRPGERVGGHGVGRAEASGGRQRGWLPGTSEESSQVLESLYIVPRTWKVSLGTAVEGDRGLPLWAP